MPEPVPTVSRLQAILDGFNRHDLDAIMASFADDAVRGCDLWTFRDGQVLRKDSYWKIVEPPMVR